MTYEEWEKFQGISPSSPEALYAEKAWNDALREVYSAMQVKRPLGEVLESLMTEEL